MTALCVFSNPCPFCTSCFCLGVHFPNSYPVLQELLEIPHWNTMVFPPRVWARPQDNMFLPQAVEQVMEDRVPGTVTDLARGLWAPRLASRNTLEPVRASPSRTALSWLFKNKCPPNTLFPPPIPPSLRFLIFTLLVDKIYAG